MNRVVVIAGATGELGGRVVRELASMHANVRALVRPGLSVEKRRKLESLGAQIIEVDFNDHAALTRACSGGAVVVSTLAGLREVIVDLQTRLLNAAVAAGVPRFIPSDFSIDFTKILRGTNRNLDFRAEFQQTLDRADIRATSIFNGAFTDMLTGMAPFVLFKINRVLCWGNRDQLMNWTTIDDTARYTAFAALDSDTPRFLRIAGDQLSANILAETMTRITGKTHKVFKPGGLRLFGVMIGMTKFFTPKSDDLYPPWQGMQYMHNMYSGVGKFSSLDNDRYSMTWKTAKDVLAAHVKKQSASE